MENLNLPPFLPGDKVVYITGFHMKKFSLHPVIDIWQDPCGCWIIKIPTPNENNYGSGFWNRCVSCNKVYPTTYSRAGWFASSFRKAQESKFRAVSFEKIMEETEKICVN